MTNPPVCSDRGVGSSCSSDKPAPRPEPQPCADPNARSPARACRTAVVGGLGQNPSCSWAAAPRGGGELPPGTASVQQQGQEGDQSGACMSAPKK